MKDKLELAEQKFDNLQDTLFCIKQTQISVEIQKKEKFQNKLSFDYSLVKLNKEKAYGPLIPLTAKMYPSLFSQSWKFTNHQYSTPRVRQNRRNFISERYKQIPQHKQQIKRYSGIDSFWFFKKTIQQQEKKSKKKKNNNNEINQQQQSRINNQQDNKQNKIQQTYIKILTFGKQPIDLINSLISKVVLKNYISAIFGQTFALRFLNFYQFKSYINYKQFQILSQKFSNVKIRQAHLINFFLYDQNNDGFICPNDVFNIFQKQLSSKIQKDVLKIVNFVRKNIDKNFQKKKDQIFIIQNVVIRDDWLTIKDYQMYFKKLDQPYLKATNKKDTVFSKSFAVIDHRQRIRSTRKQMTQKKNMYFQLFGQITKHRKNSAYIDSDDYKLNYQNMYEIFGQERTELFIYFLNYIFGV